MGWERRNVRAALGIHGHVVQSTPIRRADVCHEDGAFVIDAEDVALMSGYDQQIAVRREAEPGRLTGHVRVTLDGTGNVNRIHGPSGEIGVPETAIVPPRTLNEPEAVGYNRHVGTHIIQWSHNNSVLPAAQLDIVEAIRRALLRNVTKWTTRTFL